MAIFKNKKQKAKAAKVVEPEVVEAAVEPEVVEAAVEPEVVEVPASGSEVEARALFMKLFNKKGLSRSRAVAEVLSATGFDLTK